MEDRIRMEDTTLIEDGGQRGQSVGNVLHRDNDTGIKAGRYGTSLFLKLV